MSKKSSGKRKASSRRAEWRRFAAMTDDDIQRGIEADPDARNTDADFWRNARIVAPLRKTPVTLRLDADLLAWFRRKTGYQTEINAVLRTYMRAKRGPRPQENRDTRGRRKIGAAAE
jgi:uncharacterized protein (DUF4415 family)